MLLDGVTVFPHDQVERLVLRGLAKFGAFGDALRRDSDQRLPEPVDGGVNLIEPVPFGAQQAAVDDGLGGHP